MSSGDVYRARALECVEAADLLADPKRKVVLLELAQRWLTLAAQMERMESRRLQGDALLATPKPTNH
jgi:hypothetical protein